MGSTVGEIKGEIQKATRYRDNRGDSGEIREGTGEIQEGRAYRIYGKETGLAGEDIREI
jgi:hypothetical protein